MGILSNLQAKYDNMGLTYPLWGTIIKIQQAVIVTPNIEPVK
jgi:hypothetical protein